MQVIEQLKQMSEERFTQLYEVLSQNGFGPLDGEVAKALRFRPQAVRKLPFEKRAKRARAMLLANSNAELTYELFGTYILKKSPELMTDFLDATGVAHDEGMIEDLDDVPDEAKIPDAVAQLDEKFEPEDVTLYLGVCAQQWPDVGLLDSIWRERIAGAVSP